MTDYEITYVVWSWYSGDSFLMWRNFPERLAWKMRRISPPNVLQWKIMMASQNHFSSDFNLLGQKPVVFIFHPQKGNLTKNTRNNRAFQWVAAVSSKQYATSNHNSKARLAKRFLNFWFKAFFLKSIFLKNVLAKTVSHRNLQKLPHAGGKLSSL